MIIVVLWLIFEITWLAVFSSGYYDFYERLQRFIRFANDINLFQWTISSTLTQISFISSSYSFSLTHVGSQRIFVYRYFYKYIPCFLVFNCVQRVFVWRYAFVIILPLVYLYFKSLISTENMRFNNTKFYHSTHIDSTIEHERQKKNRGKTNIGVKF